MKNYEYITKNLDSLIKFVEENDIQIGCDECRKYGFECYVDNCTKNTIEYLKMDRIEEIVPKNELSIDEFNNYIGKLRSLANMVNNIDTYTGTNYIRNHMKDLENRGTLFNNNQKSLLSKEFNKIDSAINHLESLRETIEKYK